MFQVEYFVCHFTLGEGEAKVCDGESPEGPEVFDKKGEVVTVEDILSDEDSTKDSIQPGTSGKCLKNPLKYTS